VHYTGTLEDGSQFDSSVGRDPLEFTIGAGQMIAGFDRAVLGMTGGEKKTVIIPAAEAYGERSDDLVVEVSRDELPEGITPEVGMILMRGNNVVTVIAVSETTFTIDTNHELAGEDLIFEIELVSIK
ncbi:MAG: peptidylprolyl isomerase, partial [Dehalococcoidales bacterium]